MRQRSGSLSFIMLCVIVALVGGFGAIVMGAAGDTVADRELGQIDMLHGGFNLVDANGFSIPATFQGAALDTSVSPNRLYVADGGNNRVLAWNNAASFLNGAPADLVIGKTDFFPGVWNGTTGQPCLPVTASTLCSPSGIAVDHNGNLYVADTGNNRVLEYFAPVGNNPAADVVFGQLGSFTSNVANNGGVTANSLRIPLGLAIDSDNNLYVADLGNNRVLEFNRLLPTFTSASLVFGQNGDLTSDACNLDGISAGSLCGAVGVVADASDNLYIADGNNRVLEYDTPLVKGTTARLVFGQPNMNSDTCNSGGISSSSLCAPWGVGTDNLNRLYIVDSANARVLGYDAPLSGDTTATLVLGQGGSFDSALCNKNGVSAESLCAGAVNLAADNSLNLYVPDSGNNRLLVYADPFKNGPAAGRVLGQTYFNQNIQNFTDGVSLAGPSGIAIDASVTPNRLYVADTNNNRVLAWKNAAEFVNEQPPDMVIGQPDLLSSACNNGGISAASLCFNIFGGDSSGGGGVAVDAAGNLYVADSMNNRVLEYNSPFTTDAIADLVFGQGDSFNTGDCNHNGLGANSLCFPAYHRYRFRRR
jgi:sugar lactone lactonase YvrE